jgi:hypothetical protein
MFKKKFRPNEKLLEHYRKHELTLLPKILQCFFLLYIPWYLGIRYEYVFSSPIHTRIFLFWTGVVLLIFLRAFLVWRMNVYYLTSERLLHIEHEKGSVFKKTVSETALQSIQNVSFKTTGFLSSVFRYGDVIVQAEGLEAALTLKRVPNPGKIKDFIWSMHLQSKGEQKIV